MSFFFCEGTLSIRTEAAIGGETAHHLLAVRRVKAGEEIELQDAARRRFRTTVKKVTKRDLTIEPLEEIALPHLPLVEATLLQTNIAEQKLDLILQKATELGVARIFIWQAEHSPHAIPTERMAHKLERWRAIMRGACEQSGRPVPPQLQVCASLQEALETANAPVVMLQESATRTLAEIPVEKNVALVVGPEGGFAESEKNILRTATSARLGNYTLRAETAAIAGLGVLATLAASKKA